MPFINLNDIEEKNPVPGFNVRFVHTENMTFSYCTIEIDAELPEHSHPHEQVTSMLEGEFELTVDNETKVLKPGDVVVIPPNATHSGTAVTDCRILDVFYPVRDLSNL